MYSELPAAFTIFDKRLNCSTVEQINILPKNSALRLLFTSSETKFGFKIFSTKLGL